MTYKSVGTIIRGILSEQAPVDVKKLAEEAPAEIVDLHPETVEAPAEMTAADIVAQKYLRRSHSQKQQIQSKIIDNA